MHFSFFQNDKHQLMLVIEYQFSDPDGAMFIYDGGDTAILFHDWDNTLRFRDLPPKTREALKTVGEIRVVETVDDAIIRDYPVRVRMVSNVKSFII